MNGNIYQAAQRYAEKKKMEKDPDRLRAAIDFIDTAPYPGNGVENDAEYDEKLETVLEAARAHLEVEQKVLPNTSAQGEGVDLEALKREIYTAHIKKAGWTDEMIAEQLAENPDWEFGYNYGCKESVDAAIDHLAAQGLLAGKRETLFQEWWRTREPTPSADLPCEGGDVVSAAKAVLDYYYFGGITCGTPVHKAFGNLAVALGQPEKKHCETCEGTGRINCLPDEGEHTHPCDDCQPEANKEFQRGVAFGEAQHPPGADERANALADLERFESLWMDHVRWIREGKDDLLQGFSDMIEIVGTAAFRSTVKAALRQPPHADSEFYCPIHARMCGCKSAKSAPGADAAVNKLATELTNLNNDYEHLQSFSRGKCQELDEARREIAQLKLDGVRRNKETRQPHADAVAHLIAPAQFLCDRLDEFEVDDPTAPTGYIGHVVPALARLKAALALLRPQPGKGEV